MTIKTVSYYMWVLSWLVLVARPAAAVPVPVFHIGALVRGADVVAMGTVVGVTDMGAITVDVTHGYRTSGHRKSAALVIDQVLKGDSSLKSIQLRFIDTDEFVGYRDVVQGQYGVFLLKQRDDYYEFVSSYYPFITALAGTVVSGGAIDGIVEASAAILRSRDASTGLKGEAIGVLGQVDLKSAGSMAALTFALGDRSEAVRGVALGALLRAGDSNALAMAEAALLRPDAQTSPELRRRLLIVISQEFSVDALAIPTLGRLLAAPDTDTRRAVAQALKRTHSDVVVGLLAIALNDSDIEVRHKAVMGLSAATNQLEWSPSMLEFTMHQERYMQHWTEWLRNH